MKIFANSNMQCATDGKEFVVAPCLEALYEVWLDALSDGIEEGWLDALLLDDSIEDGTVDGMLDGIELGAPLVDGTEEGWLNIKEGWLDKLIST